MLNSVSFQLDFLQLVKSRKRPSPIRSIAFLDAVKVFRYAIFRKQLGMANKFTLLKANRFMRLKKQPGEGMRISGMVFSESKLTRYDRSGSRSRTSKELSIDMFRLRVTVSLETLFLRVRPANAVYGAKASYT